MISLADPVLGPEESEALAAVIQDAWLTMGGRAQAFEAAFAGMHGHEDAVAVSSCTAGLHLALLGLGIGPGDEVLVPSLTFVATVNAILYVGAVPRFVDIESVSVPHASLEDAEGKLSDRTRAAVVMHYGGYLADMAAWREFADRHGLVLIEDAAHAPGAPGVGTLSDATAFSFFSNKNMTTGEGGMILARTPETLDRIRRLRSHGMTTSTLDRHRGHAYSYDVTALGYNYRIDEMRAAVGMVQLKRLPASNDRRRELTRLYRAELARVAPEVVVTFAPEHENVAHLLAAVLPEGADRDGLMEGLRGRGIQSSIHYPPVHQFSCYRDRFPDVALRRTEEFARREVTLPLHPGLTDADVTRVTEAVGAVLSAGPSAG